MNQTTSSSQWYSLLAGALFLLSVMIFGPFGLLAAWLVQRFASTAPVWDPDRYWDGIRGYAIVGSLIYASLAGRVLLFASSHLDLTFSHIGQRVLLATFDAPFPVLLQHWVATLLLTPVLALLLEQQVSRTHRYPLRILTPTEKQLLAEREVERQRQEQERQRRAEAEKQRQAAAQENERKRQAASREAAVRRAAVSDTTTPSPAARQPGTPSSTSSAPALSAEEARQQFLSEQAAAIHKHTPAAPQPSPQPASPTEQPKPKREKPDKGDGSMEDLI